MASGDLVRQYRNCRYDIKTEGTQNNSGTLAKQYSNLEVASNQGDGRVVLKNDAGTGFPSDLDPSKTYTVKVYED